MLLVVSRLSASCSEFELFRRSFRSQVVSAPELLLFLCAVVLWHPGSACFWVPLVPVDQVVGSPDLVVFVGSVLGFVRARSSVGFLGCPCPVVVCSWYHRQSTKWCYV